MRDGGVMAGAGRGIAAGFAAGACWWLVETTLNWALGSIAPREVALQVAALDLILGATGGFFLGVVLGIGGRRPGPAVWALALAGVYGLLRVYAPPGFASEATLCAAAAVASAVGVVVAGPDATGVLAFVHLSLLATAATALGEFEMVEQHATPLMGVRLPLLLAALPLVGLGADRVVGIVVGRRGLRFGLELAAAGLAAVVLGRPLDPRPIDDTLVTAVPPPAGTPDVVVVTLDTTRADHLSTYGYDRPTSPNLTAFANEALRFTEARSPAAWTLPGHASLFTGMYPSRHGAHLAGAWLEGESIDGRRNVAFPLGPQAVTLAEVLRDRGYRTGAFIANFSYLYRDFGLAQGFGHYDDAPGVLLRLPPHVVRFARQFSPGYCLKPYRSARDINAAALDWLDRAPAGRPVFLFLNYMEAHQPWLATPPYDHWARELPQARALASRDLYTHAPRKFSDAERNFIVANYDGQLAAMDGALGELLAALRARGRYEHALIVVTADHGEFLGEHEQVGHIGRMLYEPVLRVPLVVKFPGADAPHGEPTSPVQLVDVLPTVVAAAGAPLPAGVQGESLLAVTHPSVAEEDINPFLVSRYGDFYNRGVKVVYDGSYKLITTTRGEQMLFDLQDDPGETHDLAREEPERVAELRQRLATTLGATVAVAGSSRVDHETN